MTAAVSASASEKEVSAEKAARGLKGIIAADTKICDVDGDEGKLVYRGYNIHELAKKSSFEETAYLLFKGELPNSQEFTRLSASVKFATRRQDNTGPKISSR